VVDDPACCSAASHRAICGLRCCISAWPGSSWCARVLGSWTPACTVAPRAGIVERANRARQGRTEGGRDITAPAHIHMLLRIHGCGATRISRCRVLNMRIGCIVVSMIVGVAPANPRESFRYLRNAYCANQCGALTTLLLEYSTSESKDSKPASAIG
jgi:hypothetical protein